PFALPICSLMSLEDPDPPRKQGRDPILRARLHSGTEICNKQRIFTQANRYCEDGEWCDVVPQFLWYMKFQYAKERTDQSSAPLLGMQFGDIGQPPLPPRPGLQGLYHSAVCNFPEAQLDNEKLFRDDNYHRENAL